MRKVDRWVASIPKVAQWSASIDKSSTRSHYEDHLYLYWNRYLNVKYKTIDDWVSTIQTTQKGDTKFVVNTWALELQNFFQTYTVKNTGRPIGVADKGLYAASVSNFLNFYLPREVTYPYKIEPTVEELQRQQKTAMSFEEVRALYNAAQKPETKRWLWFKSTVSLRLRWLKSQSSGDSGANLTK